MSISTLQRTVQMIVIVFQNNEDDYYNALGISKDNDYELHLVRP